MTRTLLVLLFFFLPCSLTFADGQPNILFIAIDDLRPELGCYGSDVAITPNIDKLAEKSLLFERAYCNIPVCGASRASLMTGLYPISGKRFLNYSTRVDKDAPNAVTLPQVFKQSGYTTISNGKIFHHAEDTQDHSWSEPAWRPKGPSARGVLPETRAKLSKRGRGHLFESADVEDDAYHDGKIATKTIEDLRELKKANKPFFLACGFFKPHLPFYAPKKYWDLYDTDNIPLADNRYTPKDAPDALRGSGEFNSYYRGDLKVNSDEWHLKMKHGYLACTSYADAQVGRVLDELNKLGLADNTIVVLWGDHGFHLGEHNFWGKHNTLDNAARVPLIIHVPNKVRDANASGKKTRSLVETVDLFPTLCDLSGLQSPKELQGKSMLPLFDNPKITFRHSVYCRFGSADAVFTEHFAYSRFNNDPNQAMLFDHSVDAEENQNLINHPGYVPNVRHHNELLDRRMKEAAAK